MTGHIDPTKEIFAAFRANDRPGPIQMLNLVRLHAQAKYPDGRKATGWVAYESYGRESVVCAFRFNCESSGRDSSRERVGDNRERKNSRAESCKRSDPGAPFASA